MADDATLPPLSEAQIQARRDLLAAEQAKLTPAQAVANLVDLFDLQEVEPDLYRVSTGDARGERLFGGQVIAQSMVAALRSAPKDKVIHSLHAYFLRGGSDRAPIDLTVNRDFEGRSFANRRVVAAQEGKAILNLAASFQMEQPGMDHQVAMPDLPPPEACRPDYETFIAKPDVSDEQFRWYAKRKPIEIRSIPRQVGPTGAIIPYQYALWFRISSPLPDDPVMHYAGLSYLSDYGLLGASLLMENYNSWETRVVAASLDHGLWFHCQPKADEWLLYTMESDWTGGSRGLNRGRIFDTKGKLVASVMQEGMLRLTHAAPT